MGRCLVATVLFLTLLLPMGLAERVTLYDWTECQRDWKANQNTMRAQLRFFVDGENGINEQLYVNLKLKLKDEAPLRFGEVETFRITGQILTGGSGSVHHVRVTVEPKVAYYKYETIGGTVTVVSTYGYADGVIGHDGRIEVGAPATVKDAEAKYTTPDEPFTLLWNDFGFADCNEAPTEYKVSIYRQQLFSSPKLVAKGIVGHQDGDLQKFKVSQGGEHTSEGEVWFENGKTYVVYVRYKRLGTQWYSDDFGAPFIGRFVWKNGDGRMKLQACQDVLSDKAATVRQRVFERLYPR